MGLRSPKPWNCRVESAAGPSDWWRRHAFAVDEGIQDVAVARPRFPIPAPGEERGAITLCVLADTLDGAPSEAQLEKLRAALSGPGVRPVGTQVTVQAATRKAVDVVADITLAADAPADAFDALPARLAQAWATARRLGWSVVESWIHAALSGPGVARVTLRDWRDVICDPTEAPLLRGITLYRRE